MTHRLDISQKESYRWLLGYQQATDLTKQCPETEVVMLADRESDVYDLYEKARETKGKKARWLIRVKTKNRALINKYNKRDNDLLHEKMATMSPQQQIAFYMPKRNGEPGRLVKQSLKIARVTLHPPTGKREKLRCSPVEVTVLVATETSPPKGEKPVEWWLITDVAPDEIEEPADLIR